MTLMNAVPTFLVGNLGLNIQGGMVLTTRGRKSGEPRPIVVNPLELNGATYLMSPRGETQWVRNLWVDNSLTLHRGSRRASYRAVEITDSDEKYSVIRAYLDRWSWQVKSLMGVGKGSPDNDVRAIVESHPVFVLQRI